MSDPASAPTVAPAGAAPAATPLAANGPDLAAPAAATADSGEAATAATATPEAAETSPRGVPARPRRRPSDAARWHLDAVEEPEAEGWLLTYLDLITLMLVMLVVLLAFGRSRSVEELPSHTATAPLEEATPTVPAPGATGDPWAGLPRDHFGADVELMVSAETIRFRISDAILFASGEAELSNRGVRVLERLLPTLAAAPHQLVVEGHTDDQPIGTTRFPSNWELSTARAARVVRYLERRGIDAARLRATGYAATRPIADNGDPQQRGRNRRVELILQRGD